MLNDFALEPRRLSPFQDELRWLVVALLIVVIASWSVGGYGLVTARGAANSIHYSFSGCPPVPTHC